MTTGRRRHLSLHLTGEAAALLDAWRRRWDPVMTELTPPHITLVYPEETTDEGLLLERLADAARSTPPIVLRLGAVCADDDGRGGVYVEVVDTSGHLEGLRDRLLLPPQLWSGVPFHSTIAHPRTSTEPDACWTALRGQRADLDVTVSEVVHTETTSDGRRILATFTLGTRAAPILRTALVGAVIARDGRVLLGMRSRDRSSYPGVWDIPGGHVDDGESPRTALQRELREELGIDAELGQPWRRIVDEEAGIELIVWRLERWDGTVANCAPEEHETLEWFRPEELAALAIVDQRITALIGEALRSAPSS